MGILWSRLDAELVAFRILHDGDVVVPLNYRGAQGDQTIDFLAHGGERAEVKVHSVGCGLWPATTSEPDVRATPAGRLDVGAFGGGFSSTSETSAAAQNRATRRASLQSNVRFLMNNGMLSMSSFRSLLAGWVRARRPRMTTQEDRWPSTCCISAKVSCNPWVNA